MRERKRGLGWLASSLAALAVCGCHFRPLPDPNDPKDVGKLSLETVRSNLHSASDLLNAQVAKRILTDRQARQLLTERAQQLIQQAQPIALNPKNAWQVGELFIAAKAWPQAEQALQTAVKNAPNEDRRVNDSLRLARTEAELGHIDQAIAGARGTLNAARGDAGPILLAVLLEIVPAAEGKGHDVELGKLLEDSIAIHRRVIVDPQTPYGRDFLIAKPHHIGRAWEKAIELYVQGKRGDLALAAAKRADAMRSELVRM